MPPRKDFALSTMNTTLSASKLASAAKCLHLYSLSELAWLAHESEWHNDDVTMMAVSDEVDRRQDASGFLDAYRSVLPEHARARKCPVHGGVG